MITSVQSLSPMEIVLNPKRSVEIRRPKSSLLNGAISIAVASGLLWLQVANAQPSQVRAEGRIGPSSDKIGAPQAGASATVQDQPVEYDHKRDHRHPRMADKLRGLDIDRDGAISRAELETRHQRQLKHFEQADADRDGKLTVDELRAFRARHRKERHSEQRNDSGPAPATQ